MSDENIEDAFIAFCGLNAHASDKYVAEYLKRLKIFNIKSYNISDLESYKSFDKKLQSLFVGQLKFDFFNKTTQTTLEFYNFLRVKNNLNSMFNETK